MNCRRVSSLISAYIDGELTGIEMLEIRRHLESCRSCTLQYESLRLTKQLLSRLAYAEPRAGLADRICKRLDEVAVPQHLRLWHKILDYGHRKLTPVAAGCAALGAILAFLVSDQAGQPQLIRGPQPKLYASPIPLPQDSANMITPVVSINQESQAWLVPSAMPVSNETENLYLIGLDFDPR